LIHKLKVALVGAAVASALLAPAYAFAAPQVSYTTTLQPAGPTMLLGNYYGSLTFTVGSDGIIQGWYKPQYGGFVPVSGSVSNGTYWLEFGNSGAFQVYATKQANGTLKGTATDTAAMPSVYPPTYDFVASPGNS
jgi:hypothetical protein